MRHDASDGMKWKKGLLWQNTLITIFANLQLFHALKQYILTGIYETF
jgi:hypothetical protein